MNTCTTRRVALTPLAVSMALALAACGGGNGDEAPIFQRGEVVTFAATLADGSTEESHYLMHGVTADGDLVAQDEGLAKLAPKRPPLAGVLVALPLEQGGGSAGLAALRDFYKQLWQGIAEHRSDGSDIAAEIGAYETDVGTLYDDYRRSGFSSVKDYVVFYEQVGENPFFSAQETVEQDLVFFFYRTGWAQGEWLRALQRQNLDWPRFLKLMAERQDTFADLMYEYFVWSEAGGTGMDAFIAHYARLSVQAKAGVAQATGAEKFFVTNKSWGVRINAREQSSVAILSSQDTNISHYHRVGEKKDICPTRLTIRGRLGVAQAALDWKMQYTEEKHASLPGTFVSSFGMEHFSAKGEVRTVVVPDPDGGTTQTTVGVVMSPALVKSLSVNLEIKDLKNIGTEAEPRPGFTARVKVTPSFIFNSPWVRTCEVT